MARAALKLVESRFTRTETEVWKQDESAAHSLHYLVSWPEAFPSSLPAHFIDKYTVKGDVVLDPFCGSGTTPLEAKLRGRAAVACDLNPLAVKITRAKLDPADLTEVTLRLQMAVMKRPVDTATFKRTFAEFYDISTYRELINLREMLAGNEDRVSAFIEAVALGILHGHSAGFLSVYTNPQISLSPEAQLQLNLKRSQAPEYRAVIPRILRKTAVVLRDGVHSSYRSAQLGGRCVQCDARNLNNLSDGSVNLVITQPPLAGDSIYGSEMWLRNWFARIPPTRVSDSSTGTIEGWLDFMNEVLFELARVVMPGGRAILDLSEIRVENRTILLDEEILKLVEEVLQTFWTPESILIHQERTPSVDGTRMRRETSRHRILVLRRR